LNHPVRIINDLTIILLDSLRHLVVALIHVRINVQTWLSLVSSAASSRGDLGTTELVECRDGRTRADG